MGSFAWPTSGQSGSPTMGLFEVDLSLSAVLDRQLSCHLVPAGQHVTGRLQNLGHPHSARLISDAQGYGANTHQYAASWAGRRLVAYQYPALYLRHSSSTLYARFDLADATAGRRGGGRRAPPSYPRIVAFQYCKANSTSEADGTSCRATGECVRTWAIIVM